MGDTQLLAILEEIAKALAGAAEAAKPKLQSMGAVTRYKGPVDGDGFRTPPPNRTFTLGDAIAAARTGRRTSQKGSRFRSLQDGDDPVELEGSGMPVKMIGAVMRPSMSKEVKGDPATAGPRNRKGRVSFGLAEALRDFARTRDASTRCAG